MLVLEIAGVAVSILIGLLGLGFGAVERRERTKAESIANAYLFSHLNRVRSLTPYRVEIDRLLSGSDERSLSRWCWQMYKGMSDLYANTVAHYLASQSRFTYEDLERLTRAGLVETTWEETVWRDLISLRPENKEGEIPPRYIEASGEEAGTSVRLGTYSPSLRGEYD